MGGTENLLLFFLRFLIIAVAVAYGASRLRIPYTIAMVLVGLGVGILRLGQGHPVGFELEPDLILLILLPGLLFEASYHIDLTLLRANLRSILWLAVPGVLISTFVVGGLVFVGLRLPLLEALLFGVMISATDPVAVVSLFKELGVDKRLGIIVEGESLFNDGVSIVVYTILVGVASGTSSFSLANSLVSFVVTVAGGAMLGLILGFLVAELMKRTDDPLLNIALTFILAYGTYLLAEEGLHGQVSPVIAVVVAGIVLGNYGSRGRHSATSTTMIVTFWEFIVFLINSAVFLLIGLEIEIGTLVDNLGPLLMALGAILIARAVVVYGLRLVINRRPPQLSLEWAHVMSWGGMRGAVSIALVLSLPQQIESRGEMLALVFGCVLFTVIVQGLSIRPLLDRLGLTKPGENQREFEEAMARLAADQASSDAIERMRADHLLSKPMADRLRGQFEERIQEGSLDLFRMVAEEPSLAEANVRLIQREIGLAQKQALLRQLRRGAISDEVYAQFTAQIDERLQGPATVDWALAIRAKDMGQGSLASDVAGET